MDVYQIIDSEESTTEELIFVVEMYIKEKKDITVKINLEKGMHHGIHSTFKNMLMKQQLTMLMDAYLHASKYFSLKRQNN